MVQNENMVQLYFNCLKVILDVSLLFWTKYFGLFQLLISKVFTCLLSLMLLIPLWTLDYYPSLNPHHCAISCYDEKYCWGPNYRQTYTSHYKCINAAAYPVLLAYFSARTSLSIQDWIAGQMRSESVICEALKSVCPPRLQYGPAEKLTTRKSEEVPQGVNPFLRRRRHSRSDASPAGEEKLSRFLL